MKVIRTGSAPAPAGPYSQGILYGNFIFTSGQLGIDPETGKLRDDFKEQAEQALKNMISVVEAAGGSRCSIVKVTVFIRDVSRFKEFNDVYENFFRSCPFRPTRSVVEVSGLPLGADVEVECIAVRG
ncbi:MAG: Rid family detoxifying hydrolase [Desulfurobacteriaceae bacterium]